MFNKTNIVKSDVKFIELYKTEVGTFYSNVIEAKNGIHYSLNCHSGDGRYAKLSLEGSNTNNGDWVEIEWSTVYRYVIGRTNNSYRYYRLKHWRDRNTGCESHGIIIAL